MDNTSKAESWRARKRCTLYEAQERLIQVKLAISKLKEEEEELEELIDNIQNLDIEPPAPHPYSYSLPLELWLTVFTHSRQNSDRDSLDVGGPPWVFAQVCHTWREIVMATPELWAHVRIRATECGHHLRPTLFRLNRQLFHSRNGPLCIDIDADEIGTHAVDLILQALLSHCGRWDYVAISNLNHTTFLSQPSLHYSSPCDPTFPILSSLSLSLKRPPSTDARVLEDFARGGSPWAVEDAPQLKRIYLTKVYVPRYGVPWQQLVDVSLVDVNATQAFHMLSCLRDVVRLSMSFKEDSSPSLALMQPLCLPYLESIRISDREDDLLMSVTAPQLKKVEIGTRFYLDIASLHVLIERSGALLTELVIRHAGLPPTSLENLYRVLPSLKYLRIEMDGFCGRPAKIMLKPLLILDAGGRWYCRGLRYVCVESDWAGRGRVSSHLFFRRIIGDISGECFDARMESQIPADRYYTNVTITATDSFGNERDVNDFMEDWNHDGESDESGSESSESEYASSFSSLE